jgi:hypothetical protein
VSAALKPQPSQGPDVTLERRDGFAYFIPHTERAKAWARAYVPEDDGSICFPDHSANLIAARLVDRGLSVASAAV